MISDTATLEVTSYHIGYRCSQDLLVIRNVMLTYLHSLNEVAATKSAFCAAKFLQDSSSGEATKLFQTDCEQPSQRTIDLVDGCIVSLRV